MDKTAPMDKIIIDTLKRYREVVVPVDALVRDDDETKANFAKFLFNTIPAYPEQNQNVVSALQLTYDGFTHAILPPRVRTINESIEQHLSTADYHLIEPDANFGTFSLNSVANYKSITMLCKDIDDFICCKNNAQLLFPSQRDTINVRKSRMDEFFNQNLAIKMIVEPTIIFMNFMCKADTVDDIYKLWEYIESYIMVSFGRQIIFEAPAVLVFYTPPEMDTHHFRTCKWFNIPVDIKEIKLNKKCPDTGGRIPGSKLFIISRKTE